MNLRKYCPELSDIFRHTALAKGLEQDTARSFVHDDDVVARQLVLGVRRHEGNVPFAGCRYLGRRWLWTDRILARFFNLRQCLLNAPLEDVLRVYRRETKARRGDGKDGRFERKSAKA